MCPPALSVVVVVYYCSTYYKAVRVGEGDSGGRGEPINERADTVPEEGREISDDNKRWDVPTDRITYEMQKVSTTVRSVWPTSVRNAFRRQVGWAKLQEVRATAAKHWTERV